MGDIESKLNAATDAVNAASIAGVDRIEANAYRHGLLDAAEIFGADVGAMLRRQDLRQFELGHDRTMCGGVWFV
jgi:hypothetical protein